MAGFGGSGRSRPGGDSRSLLIAVLAALVVAAVTIVIVTVVVAPDRSAAAVPAVAETG
jgi:hypothetical protein